MSPNDNEDKLTTDAIRKREDNYFKYLIIELSDGIKEDGEEYINELFNYAKGFNIVYYSNMKNDWIVRLPSIGDTVIDKFTSISKAKIEMTAMEERIVDEIHQRVLDGEKVINTAFLLNTGENYIGTLYYLKYQKLYDYMVGVSIDEAGGKKNINLIISKIVDDQEVDIYMPTEWLDLQILVDSIKRPLFNYIYDSEDAKDDKEIFNYLKNKTGAVVFNPDFEGAYKEFK